MQANLRSVSGWKIRQSAGWQVTIASLQKTVPTGGWIPDADRRAVARIVRFADFGGQSGRAAGVPSSASVPRWRGGWCGLARLAGGRSGRAWRWRLWEAGAHQPAQPVSGNADDPLGILGNSCFRVFQEFCAVGLFSWIWIGLPVVSAAHSRQCDAGAAAAADDHPQGSTFALARHDCRVASSAWIGVGGSHVGCPGSASELDGDAFGHAVCSTSFR